jgi:membrane protein implicated in regulation of membrane protease activity
MQALMESFNAMAAWHWWALGAILIALEIASTTSYLLWPGFAALLVGFLKFLMPGLSGEVCAILFAVLAVGSTLAWKRSPWGHAPRATHALLNERTRSYIGRMGRAADDFHGEQGAILLDDTRWSAVTQDGSMPLKGEMLQVAAVDGAVLKVRRVGVLQER